MQVVWRTNLPYLADGWTCPTSLPQNTQEIWRRNPAIPLYISRREVLSSPPWSWRARRMKLPLTTQQPPDRIYIHCAHRPIKSNQEDFTRLQHYHILHTVFYPEGITDTIEGSNLTSREQLGEVYSISCACCNHHYVAEIGRNLKTRKEEHNQHRERGIREEWYCRVCSELWTPNWSDFY